MEIVEGGPVRAPGSWRLDQNGQAHSTESGKVLSLPGHILTFWGESNFKPAPVVHGFAATSSTSRKAESQVSNDGMHW